MTKGAQGAICWGVCLHSGFFTMFHKNLHSVQYAGEGGRAWGARSRQKADAPLYLKPFNNNDGEEGSRKMMIIWTIWMMIIMIILMRIQMVVMIVIIEMMHVMIVQMMMI